MNRVAGAERRAGAVGVGPAWVEMHHPLFTLLLDLDGVQQSPRYHPEGDALYHSLQVFDLAYAATDDPELWAAALFHDVGKACTCEGESHDAVGAELLEGLVSPRVCWLVLHHLDLLRDPRRTMRRLANTSELRDLMLLRRWDLGGRSPHAIPSTPQHAMHLLTQHHERNA